MIGRTLSHYEILDELGSGGMGVLFRAHDTRLGRQVALKVLPERFAADPERRRRLIQEARAASALNHPNIVTIYEVGRASTSDGELDFIAMELVDGEPLDRHISHDGLPIEETLRYAVETASASP